MDYQKLIATLTPELVARFKQALEIGRWPDGRKLDTEQRQHCMQAVIAWEQQHLPESDRVGYIDRGRKAAGALSDENLPTTLQWANQREMKE